MIRTTTRVWRLRPLVAASVLVIACHREAPAGSERNPGVRSQDSTLGAPAPDSSAQSAAHFVQAFYEWYKRTGDRYEVAVRDSAGFFDPVLLSAMRLDLVAQAGSPGAVSGLDWDPVLATQDPCDPYQVSGTTRRGDTILVAVNGMCADRPPQVQPDVIAEVRRVGRRWVFVDFRHAEDLGSLRQDLKALREGRGPDTAHASR